MGAGVSLGPAALAAASSSACKVSPGRSPLPAPPPAPLSAPPQAAVAAEVALEPTSQTAATTNTKSPGLAKTLSTSSLFDFPFDCQQIHETAGFRNSSGACRPSPPLIQSMDMLPLQSLTTDDPVFSLLDQTLQGMEVDTDNAPELDSSGLAASLNGFLGQDSSAGIFGMIPPSE